MKITRLGRAGVCLTTRHTTILIDPSADGIAKAAIPSPDVLLITHGHEDRLNRALLTRLLSSDRCITVLAPEGAYHTLRAMGGGHRYVLMRPHSVYSVETVTFYAVRAEHGDTPTIGFIIDDGNKTCYAVGDTLYNYDVLDDVLDLVEDGVDCVLVPLSGEDNTMHPKDAADFAYEIGAHSAVPLCYGLYEGSVPKQFDFDNAMYLSTLEAQDIG